MSPRKHATSLAAAALLFAAAPPALAQEAPAPIYGQQLMTPEEQAQHRERLRVLESNEEREAFRKKHRNEMQTRARERNVELPDVAAPKRAGKGAAAAGKGTMRGRDMMGAEERERHREEMRSKTSEEERERARREKHEEMQERAREQGMELPDKPQPRGGGGPRGGAGSGKRRGGGPR